MHDTSPLGPWGPRGLQRQVRMTTATGLHVLAAILNAAATVAGTIAKELRLTLDEPSSPASPQADAPAARGRDEGDGQEGGADVEPTVRIVDASTDRPPATTRRGPAPTSPAVDDGHGAPGDARGPSPWVDDVAADVAGGSVRAAIERLGELTAPQLRALERYERSRRQRVTLLRAVDAELSRRE